jgi:hypothetical protein
MRTRFLFIPLGLLALLVALAGTPVLALPLAQFTPFPTPTPGPDGRIIYIAQENDSAWRIAAIFGIDLNELRSLNKWGDNPIITPGMEVLLGFAGPAEVVPTQGPSPTPVPQLPTPSPLPGWGNLCVILYNDANGDSLRQEDEPSIRSGAISVTNRAGTVSQTENTTEGLEHLCIEELPEGDYNVSVAVPDGYNPTTITNRALVLKAGDITYIDFGAQANSQTAAEVPVPQGSGRSPLLAIVGGLILLVGIGLGIFAGRYMKP